MPIVECDTFEGRGCSKVVSCLLTVMFRFLLCRRSGSLEMTYRIAPMYSDACLTFVCFVALVLLPRRRKIFGLMEGYLTRSASARWEDM